MTIRDDQREKVTERLAAHLLDTGLSQASLRQLARAAGVSDRMLLYYFDDKAAVLSAATARIAAQSVAGLAETMPEGTRLPPRELVKLDRRTWVNLVTQAGPSPDALGDTVDERIACSVDAIRPKSARVPVR